MAIMSCQSTTNARPKPDREHAIALHTHNPPPWVVIIGEGSSVARGALAMCSSAIKDGNKGGCCLPIDKSVNLCNVPTLQEAIAIVLQHRHANK